MNKEEDKKENKKEKKKMKKTIKKKIKRLKKKKNFHAEKKNQQTKRGNISILKIKIFQKIHHFPILMTPIIIQFF